MKNTQLYPFERNRYYYGMLLSVEDLNAEQKYMNDKRRLLNRLIHGAGVVSGLNVVKIDERTISVENGLALDNTGREILVDLPITRKLSDIKGYDTAMSEHNRYMYLCIEYKEDEKGVGHSVSASESRSVSDRVREGYSIFLTSSEPESGLSTTNEMFTHSTVVYWDGELRIKHTMPRYINPLTEFEFKVEIETFTKRFVSLSYDIQLVCLNSTEDDSSVLSVKFNEMLYEKSGKYTLTYKLRANNVSDVEGTAAIDSSTFRLSFDNLTSDKTAQGKSAVSVISGSVREAVIHSVYDRSMDSVLREVMPQRLYLARINIINAGELYIIDSIDNVPFGQYVVGNPLLKALNDSCQGTVIQQVPVHDATVDFSQVLTEKNGISMANKEIASGVCRINLNIGSLKNKVFYSDEIVHTLGLGSVTIILGAVGSDGSTVYGSTGIFPNEVTEMEMAAKLNPSKGSFVIGVMMKNTVVAEHIDIKWTAIKDVDETISEQRDMKIMIKPNSLVVKPRENKYLEAICSNMTNKTVRWSVASPGGGEIDGNGLYTAPNVEGVYEVVAQSAVYNEVKASIMVVVRE